MESLDLPSRLKHAPRPRILVVEDIRENADLYVHFLVKRGFAVNLAREGFSGLRLAQVVRPDLILLNEQMPGLCGLEVLARLRAAKATAAITVVMISGHSMSDQALSAGAFDFILLPVSADEFATRISRALAMGAKHGPQVS